MKEIVFLNGEFLPKEEANISIEDKGFLCGVGLFETMRSCNRRIVYFDQHLARIKSSCKVIDLKFPKLACGIKKIINKTVEINYFKDAYVRLTLWESVSRTGVLVIASKYKPYPLEKYKKGFTARVVSLKQNESILSRIKTTNRLFYERCLSEAKSGGFDEAIILNNSGYIAETSRSNIFLIKENTVFTPSLECGCLDGITRKVVLDLAKKHNIKACEGNFTLQDLFYSEEVFLTNSLIGVMPLRSLEKIDIGKPEKYKLTNFFRKQYSLLLKNEI